MKTFLILLLLCGPAVAHDHSNPAQNEWYQSLMQPDNPTMSCCGEADAYWADDVHFRGGKTYVTITDDRDDVPLKRPHIPNGTEIEVPNNLTDPAFISSAAKFERTAMGRCRV